MTNKKKDKQKDPDQENQNEELESWQQKANEYLDGWKRAKADYSNYKKEVEARQKEIIEFANARLIAELLPIYENFKTAWKHVPEDSKNANWLAGFGHIKNQFSDFLKSLGIEEVKTVGEKFNPEIHEAVESAEAQNFEPDIIFEEVQAGYTLHGKVVNPAKVKVAK